MFIINKKCNTIEKIEEKKFHELGFGERTHLQEWIADNPNCLCNENDENDRLLIIQKEFDGFNDTNERLDLLAIDKTGALVVIENKLDDTGRDVVWQALKYVSYCSTLKAQEIKEIYQSYLDKNFLGQDQNAEENIVDFFDGKPFEEIPLNGSDQRMIIVAGKFRKEVTSTAIWMLDHNLNVQCFKATPYEWNDEIFLDIEQIIPVKEAQDYIIKKADKDREINQKKVTASGIEMLRKEFWTKLLAEYCKTESHFNNISPSKDHWLSCGSGVSGCTFAFLATTIYAGIELTINNGEPKRNKEIFDGIIINREAVEEQFGDKIIWERLDDKKMCRIVYKMFDVNVKDKDDWQKMIEFMCTNMPKFINALKQPLIDLKRK